MTRCLADAMALAVSFTALLERLGIPYLVGGSTASSVRGEPRSTNDIDAPERTACHAKGRA